MAVYLVPGIFGAGGQILDTNGKTAPGALINTYAAGTTSGVATFTTNLGTITAANPIVCNADGRLPNEMWQTQGQAIKIIVTDSLLNTLGTYDNLYGIGDPAATNAPTGYFILSSVGGTSNVITAATSGTLTSLSSGKLFVFIPVLTNTGATTVNVTPSGGAAFGAKSVFASGAALVGGELVANVPVILDYDGTQFNIIGNDQSYYYKITNVGGTANTITAAGPTNLAILSNGQLFTFIPTSANSGAATINITPSGSVTALGAKSIFVNGTALTGSEFVTNAPVILYYDGTQMNIVGKTPPSVASQAQQETGTALTAFTAPGVQQYHPSACKAWIRFNGVTPAAIVGSYNISGINRISQGIYLLSFTSPMSTVSYSVVTDAKVTSNQSVEGTQSLPTLLTTTNFQIVTADAAFSVIDPGLVFAQIFGDFP